jgi:hypothetical protein
MLVITTTCFGHQMAIVRLYKFEDGHLMAETYSCYYWHITDARNKSLVVFTTDFTLTFFTSSYSVHTSVSRLGTKKCTAEIANSFEVKGLGRKVRRIISHCEIRQTVKHPNCSYATDVISHLISRPGELCAVDLFGALTVRRVGVRYNVFFGSFFHIH